MNNACPKCGRRYQVEPKDIGRRILCKQCGTPLIVTSAGLSLQPAMPNPAPQAPGYPAPGGMPSGAHVYHYSSTPVPPPPPPATPFELNQDDDSEPIRRQRTRRSDSPFVDLLTFRSMITPILIQIVFWVGTAVCLFAGVRLAVGSFQTQEDVGTRKWLSDEDAEMRPPLGKSVKGFESGGPTKFSMVPFASGMAVIVFGPLLLRVYCELAIIFFKIHDELKELNGYRFRSR